MHIAIAGNIGSGKTALTKLLARHYGYRPIYESTETNPYINSFYEDMRRWSFNIQIYYLHTRTRQLLDIRKESKNIIQDRTLYEDAYIFTPNHIQARGREYESSIRLDYLTGLNKRYEDWIDKYNKGKYIIVDLTKLDFVESDEDLGMVYNMIDAEINSLFS